MYPWENNSSYFFQRCRLCTSFSVHNLHYGKPFCRFTEMTFCSFKYNSYIIYQILILWEIYFNFFWLYFQMGLLLLSYLMYLPNLSLSYTLFCLPKSVFSHIKKIDKKETCQRLIAQVLNCHCKPCDHRESFFSFHGVSQLISQWHFTAAVIFFVSSLGHDGLWPVPQHLFCFFLPVSVL